MRGEKGKEGLTQKLERSCSTPLNRWSVTINFNQLKSLPVRCAWDDGRELYCYPWKCKYKNVFQFLVCELCKVNLRVPVKYGSKAPTVPLLFLSTNNNWEFTSSLGGETMVLAKLLLDIFRWPTVVIYTVVLYVGHVPERSAASTRQDVHRRVCWIFWTKQWRN